MKNIDKEGEEESLLVLEDSLEEAYFLLLSIEALNPHSLVVVVDLLLIIQHSTII